MKELDRIRALLNEVNDETTSVTNHAATTLKDLKDLAETEFVLHSAQGATMDTLANVIAETKENMDVSFNNRMTRLQALIHHLEQSDLVKAEAVPVDDEAEYEENTRKVKPKKRKSVRSSA